MRYSAFSSLLAAVCLAATVQGSAIPVYPELVERQATSTPTPSASTVPTSSSTDPAAVSSAAVVSSAAAVSSAAVVSSAAAVSSAAVVSSAAAPAATCPAVWKTIAADLKPSFSGCSQLAAFAVRFAFHDAGAYTSTGAFYGPAAGGADGSLLLSSTEIGRSSASPMGGYRNFLLQKYNKYKGQGVTAADLVQFAANYAIKICGGPTVQTVVGRTDSATAPPDGTLPAAFGTGCVYGTIVPLFADKGFSGYDVAALVGAHTISRSFAQRNNGIPIGGAQDSTPTLWDNKFYADTLKKTARVYSFQSDINLSLGNDTGAAFQTFAADANAWNAAFTSAMYRMSILGIPAATSAGFVDCSSALS